MRGRVDSESSARLPPPICLVLERALPVEADRRFADMTAMLGALQSTLGSAEQRFDTQQVDAVLARAAELHSVAPSRPGLTPGEVEAAGIEAGFDPVLVRRAAAEALAAPDEPAPPPVPVPIPARPSGEFDEVVTVTRECPPIRPEVAASWLARWSSRRATARSNSSALEETAGGLLALADANRTHPRK